MTLLKILSKVLLVLLIILTVGLAVRAVLNYATGRKLTKFLEKSRAEGTIIPRKDLVPECLRSENAARLWTAAEALYFEPDDGSSRGDTRDLNLNLNEGEAIEEGLLEKLAPVVDRNRRCFEIIREAADMPCYLYGDWDRRNVKLYDLEIPNAVVMLQVIRLMGAGAIIQAESGNVEGAIEECLFGLRFMKKVSEDPRLINYLISVAGAKYILFCLNRVAGGREVGTEWLLPVMEELEPEAWKRNLVRAMQLEKLFLLEIGLDSLKRMSSDFADVMNLHFWQRQGLWWIRPATKAEIPWILSAFDEMEREGLRPYYQTREFRADFERRIEDLPWYFKLNKVLLPNFFSTWLKVASLESMLRTARAGLAGKIFKNETGRFPGGLAELSGVMEGRFEDDFMDPFTGQPFVFRLVGDGEGEGEIAGVEGGGGGEASEGSGVGFIIYSLGSNGKDDGGRSSMITQMIMENDDDWPWKEFRIK